MQKKTDTDYDLDSDDKSVYEKYYEAMKKSVKENKDYLFDLVKDKKIIYRTDVEY
ncbi:MAG: hypothetical protein SPL22_03165 [Treponema sp.]|uniref:hypothetical protein n=1 Tax=Treponema sp. TaxID=166 RepID=UPI002A90FB57|nr:hypothetical protein [Treponema sp.]MDY6396707.1 hypothetical protein [Treponema sp.]